MKEYGNEDPPPLAVAAVLMRKKLLVPFN